MRGESRKPEKTKRGGKVFYQLSNTRRGWRAAHGVCRVFGQGGQGRGRQKESPETGKQIRVRYQARS